MRSIADEGAVLDIYIVIPHSHPKPLSREPYRTSIRQLYHNGDDEENKEWADERDGQWMEDKHQQKTRLAPSTLDGLSGPDGTTVFLTSRNSLWSSKRPIC